MAIILLLLIIVVGYYFIKKARNRQVEGSHGQQRIFEDFTFSPQEFYLMVEQSIKKHKIPITASRVTHSEGSMFSANREYLRIARNENFYDICAAPYGADFFVSWRANMKEPLDFSVLPYFGKYLNQRSKTYFEIDTDAVFKSAVASSIQEAIGQMQGGQGMRGMVELTGTPKAQETTTSQIAPSN